jgi:hypothetical protein
MYMMIRRFLFALILLIVVVQSSYAATADFYQRFTDVEDDADGAVLQLLYSWGVMDGITGNQMAPKMTLTREQAVVMIHRFAEYHNVALPVVNKPLYASLDIEVGRWSYEHIDWAIKSGVMKGVDVLSDGKVITDPEGSLTHEQLAVMFGRILGGVYPATPEVDPVAYAKVKEEGVSAWAADAVFTLLFRGILPMHEGIDPSEVATRIYFARMLRTY